MRANPAYLVQGLEPDPANVARARAFIRERNLCGPVSVKLWKAKYLPFADNVVNLLVADASSRVSRDEVLRVLAPCGVALLGEKRLVKPVPDEIDEWTHFLHSAGNNAVAHDTAVGPPRYLRWTGGPKYSRNHEIDSSVVAVVTAQGRFFYIVDEGLPGFMGKFLPQTWALAARDAFSGVVLWKQPMPNMGWPQWKPGLNQADWSKLVAHRRLIPITLPRRLVAHGNSVFAVLGYHAPLSILDAASGKIRTTVEGTLGTDEILFHKDMLYISVRKQSGAALDTDPQASLQRNDKRVFNHPGQIMAVDPNSGSIRWQVNCNKLLPLSLTVDQEHVFFHNGTQVICLDAGTGKQRWNMKNTNVKSTRWNSNHTLLAQDGVLLVGTPKKLQAYAAENGELLWEGKGGRPGFMGSNPVNLYVIDGLVWSPVKNATGRDLRTGENKRSLELPKYIYTGGHHFRCYRGKATQRYLLENKRGIEMLDLQDGVSIKNDWVRGMCRYGVMPANGLIYSTPTPCSCYPEVLLTGFNALAANRRAPTREASPANPESDSRQPKSNGPKSPVRNPTTGPRSAAMRGAAAPLLHRSAPTWSSVGAWNWAVN